MFDFSKTYKYLLCAVYDQFYKDILSIYKTVPFSIK